VADRIGARVFGTLPLEFSFPVRRVCGGSKHLQCVLDELRRGLLLSAIRRQLGLMAATEEGDEAAQAWGRALRPLSELDSGLPNAGVVVVCHSHGSWFAVV
jgi:hypothetical protein